MIRTAHRIAEGAWIGLAGSDAEGLGFALIVLDTAVETVNAVALW